MALEPGSDIYAITMKNVPGVDHDVAKVDPDAEIDAPVVRNIGVALDHAVLCLNSPAHRFDRARELD